MYKLKAVVFKREEVEGKYKVHCKVFDKGVELTRFGIEYEIKPTDEEIKKSMKNKMELYSTKFNKMMNPPEEVSIEFEY